MIHSKKDTANLIQSIKNVFNDFLVQRPEILAVYLFGSLAKDKSRNSSDIDVAFLFDRSFYKNDPYNSFSIAQIMGADAGKGVRTKVDVSILNGASLFFAYEVISTGICLYEKDTNERIRYEIAIKGQYFDFKPFIMQLRQNKIAYMCASAEKHVRQ
jgi:uncharacterized protein